MIGRRGFLGGLLAAPAVIRTPGLLMAVRPPLLIAGVVTLGVTVTAGHHWRSMLDYNEDFERGRLRRSIAAQGGGFGPITRSERYHAGLDQTTTRLEAQRINYTRDPRLASPFHN